MLALIGAGADVNLANHKHSTPLHFTCFGSDPAEHPRDVLLALLDSGADPNKRDYRGNTPLLVACQSGRSDFIDLLIERGGDPTVKNQEGQGAHEVAVFFGHERIAARFGPESPANRFAR